MNHEKWHDGVGYDLDALRAASPDERNAIEATLLHRAPYTWNDVEALAALDTPGARTALRSALDGGDTRVRAAVLLRFSTTDRAGRIGAFRDLCGKLGVEADRHLR